MPTEHILTLLISERDKLNRAIAALGGRVGSAATPPPASPLLVRKRKPMTAARKKALSMKMKAAWAKRKKAEKD